MSARDELLAALRSGKPCIGANDLLDDYAHELAEKQRARVAEEEVKGFFSTLVPSQLIDLIDPEVSS